MSKIEWKYVYRRICAFILILIATCLFAYIWLDFVTVNNQTGHLTGYGNIGMALGLYVVLFFLIGKGIGAFQIGVTRITALMASIVLTAFATDFIEIFLSMAITGQFRFIFKLIGEYFFLFIIQAPILALLMIPMSGIYRKLFPPLHLLEVYGNRKLGLHKKIDTIHYKYHVEKTIHYEEGLTKIKEQVKDVDAVLISDIPSHEKNQILKLCVDLDKRAYFIPKISDIIVRYSEELNLMDTPLFLRRKIGIGWGESIVKRAFDIFGSLFGLLITSPILLITAISIKLEDHGPVFFKQERITQYGKRFMILKFRSMIVDAEKDGRPHPAGEKDDRITKVGRVIRACRIDELPQLINILKGEMSIVGPRPERVEHVEKYTQEIPEFSFREKVKGGLTGYAQVYGKYNTTALDKLKLDLMYIMDFSILLDIQILFETVKILFRKDSTEGFTEERAEEMHDEKSRESLC